MKSNMIKIAIISDIHFGVNTRLTINMYENLKNYFLSFVKNNNIDLIVIAGDYFHCKLSLNSTESQCAMSFIYQLIKETNSKIIMMQGTLSHDYDQLDIFKEFISDRFRIIKKVEKIDICDLHLLIVPEEYLPSISYYDEYIKNDMYDFVFFHGLFSFAGTYALQEGNKNNKICFPTNHFDSCVRGLVIGGHIHDHFEKGKVRYTGSFERWKFGEDLEKGFRYVEYDLNDRKVLKEKFIVNERANKYKTINYKNISNLEYEKLVEYIHNESVENNQVRIKIEKDDIINQETITKLFSLIKEFDNVVLKKEVMLKMNDEKNELKNKERNDFLNSYKNLTFNQITIKYAEDILLKKVKDTDIEEALS